MADRDGDRDRSEKGRDGQGAPSDGATERDEVAERGGAGAAGDAAKARTPRHSDEQAEAPPERPVRPDEAEDQSIDRLEDPPQAEGDRD